MLSGSLLLAIVLAVIFLAYGFLKKNKPARTFGWVMAGYSIGAIVAVLIMNLEN